ncbi:MAG: 50S ribosomal protein L18 [Pseudomonadales bacterium]
MNSKKEARLRRARRGRKQIYELGMPRLCVFRSSRHIYAQIISPEGSEVKAAASTLDASLKDEGGLNVKSAAKVGQLIAERAIEAGIGKVAFDRAGYRYHGRVKALAEGAREGGLQF